jgi:histidine triad (HIT) family protein
MSETCIFCKIIRGEIPSYSVYEDDNILAFLDINPSTLSHTLIIPKAHVGQLEDLSPEDACVLFRTLPLLVDGIQSTVGAPSSTIGVNNGPESGQEVPHIHIHVIPRSRGDRGGIIQSIVNFGRHTDTDELRVIAEKIRENIGI